uniref:Uncharacterized protein n=1 Tax=viral metagenome TaxID=1070528 RepID=A0A6C0HI39_9ZZZZ
MSEHNSNYVREPLSSQSVANTSKSCNSSVNKIHAKILHDIRNMYPLSKEQIAYIYKMSSTEQMEIIITYDAMMKHCVEYIQSIL